MEQDLEREGLKNTDGEIGLKQEEEYFILLIKRLYYLFFCMLAWEISWTEEPGRLQSMGSQELDTT